MIGRNQQGQRVTLRPFMGVMGMPPDEPGRHTTTPPRVWGGNLDCKELVAGSTLYLPIPVAGGTVFGRRRARASQGDGEISVTAIECPMDRVDLTFDLRDDFPITTPLAHTPAGWLTMGFGDDLDDATYAALERHVRADAGSTALERARRDCAGEPDGRPARDADRQPRVGVHALLPNGALR